MKIKMVINAPTWSVKEADAFGDLISKMLFDQTAYTLDKQPAFLASYDVEKPKKKAKRKK